MRNPTGYMLWSGGNGPDIERDTFTCTHCNTVVIVEPKQLPTGGFCQMCGKLICEACTGKGCTPFEKKLDLMERRDKLLRTLGV